MASPPARPIFLLSDFGLRDTYVGQMRAVIAGIAPRAAVHDLGHGVPPQDLVAGAYALGSALPWLPGGAVVCAVVDPGVGSARAAVALAGRRADGAALALIAPDNGLLEPALAALDDLRAVRIEPGRPPASRTFHGRDVFAPAAARVAAGADLAALGSPLAPDALARLEPIAPERTATGWRGRVVVVDRFGNLVTDLGARHLAGGPWRVRCAGRTIDGVRGAFAEVAEGAPVAYVGSSGRLELAVRNGSAAAAWGARAGSEVVLERIDESG